MVSITATRITNPNPRHLPELGNMTLLTPQARTRLYEVLNKHLNVWRHHISFADLRMTGATAELKNGRVVITLEIDFRELGPAGRTYKSDESAASHNAVDFIERGLGIGKKRILENIVADIRRALPDLPIETDPDNCLFELPLGHEVRLDEFDRARPVLQVDHGNGLEGVRVFRHRHVPSVKIEIHPSTTSLSVRAANMIVDVAETREGTVLTPGCNTPIDMYGALPREARKRGVDLERLLRGETGDFHMGMIDGIESADDDPLSFPLYFARHFLHHLGWSMNEIFSQSKPLFEAIRERYKHVFVPWIPEAGTALPAGLAEKDCPSHLAPYLLDNFRLLGWGKAFEQWVIPKLPIDKIIFGLGPDGHLAFLHGKDVVGAAEDEIFTSTLLRGPVRVVELWNGVRQWKWADKSEESCACIKDGSCSINGLEDTPQYALTISEQTALAAKSSVLMAMGERKAAAVKKLIEGPYDREGFIAHLIYEALGDVTILIDVEAAKKLTLPEHSASVLQLAS
ncbi:MAG: hypothetical protein ABIA67_05370 [Candidatus Margulisiibacteriota bacterium]